LNDLPCNFQRSIRLRNAQIAYTYLPLAYLRKCSVGYPRGPKIEYRGQDSPGPVKISARGRRKTSGYALFMLSSFFDRKV